MNKSLAILGAVSGALCAMLLTVGMPSFGNPFHFSGGCTVQKGAASKSRDLQWLGGDSIEVYLPASVHFLTAPNWHAEAKGPADAIDHLRIRGGHIEFDTSYDSCGDDIDIELSGPAVQRWVLGGSGELLLENIDQAELSVTVLGSGSAIASGKVQHTNASLKGSGDLNLDNLSQTEMDLEIHGSGSVSARGNAENTWVSIFGSGDAHLGKLMVKQARISIKGSGNVDIAADYADVQINGSGDVRLTKRPISVNTHIHGSGSVTNVDRI